jgi:aryl-phospho-beta-D-glucosidase BglC (GH1 family)
MVHARHSLVLVLCLLVFGCSEEAPDETTDQAAGFNLSGFEFGSTPSSGSFPTQQDLQTYAGYGAQIVRIPSRWEHFAYQSGQLSGSGASSLGSVDPLVSQAVCMDLIVLLDRHNYMR